MSGIGKISFLMVVCLCLANGRMLRDKKPELVDDAAYITENDETALNDHKKHHLTEQVDAVDFIGTRISKLGELELRIAHKGIKAMETQIPGVGEHGLFLREVTDGLRFVQAIYKDSAHLVDCDIDDNEEDIVNFIDKFFGQEGSNATMRMIEPTDKLDSVYESMVNFKPLMRSCKAFHKQQRQFQREKRLQKRRQLKKQSHKFSAAEEKQEENAKKTRAQGVSKARSKRSMWDGSYIYPGTNWCGNGNIAGGFDDLGDNIATDKCCRAHDHCPYVIEGMTSKYNVFNYRFHTLSHCTCDEIFLQCLKSASNTVADMVGGLYFNTLAMKCFVLNAERTCTERSWWGKCTTFERTYTGAIQEPLTY